MFLIEFLQESQTSHGNVFICQRRISPDSYVQWLCPLVCSHIRLGDSSLGRIWSSINEHLLFCCIAVCWSDCTWVTPTTREFAMWDFGHLEAMSSLSLHILQNPWYLSKGLLVDITANHITRVLKHQKTLGVLSISQGANEQFLQFKYSSFLEFCYWRQMPAFTFLEMTVLLCSFLRTCLSDIQVGLTQV